MSFIFLDESGDLGFNFFHKQTSKFFIISCLFVSDKKPVEKIIKNIFSSFSKKQIKHHSGVLHAYKEKPQIRRKLLEALNQKNVSIVSICLNKKKVYTQLQDEKHVLYNYVTNILIDRIYSKKLVPFNSPIQFIASRRETNKFLNLNFCNYIKNKIQMKHKLDLSVIIKTPQEEKCLQIVDFVCWSFFRKREHNDDSYTSIMKNIIVEESHLFP